MKCQESLPSWPRHLLLKSFHELWVKLRATRCCLNQLNFLPGLSVVARVVERKCPVYQVQRILRRLFVDMREPSKGILQKGIVLCFSPCHGKCLGIISSEINIVTNKSFSFRKELQRLIEFPPASFDCGHSPQGAPV